MKRLLSYILITGVFLLNIIGVVKADFATPFVDTAEVGEIATERCWLISAFQNAYLVVVATDTEEYIVLSAIAAEGVVDESLLGKPVILKAKVMEKEIRTDGNMHMRLEILSVKPAVVEQPKVTESVPQDWKRIDADGKFTFFVPPDMEAEAAQGIDSYVGEYRSNGIRLYFDYGWWSGNFCDARYTEQKPQNADVTIQIGGQRARLVTFYEPNPKMDYEFPYIAVVCFADLGTEKPGQKITLTMWATCKGRAEQQTAKRIFQSIQFSR